MNGAQGHDLSLYSGERQTAESYEGIRADHRFRYEWADRSLPAGGFGLDVFCGNGYGSWLLSQKNRIVLGVDGSAEAIQAADANYKTPRTFFSSSYWPFELPAEKFDFVVALESIEHVSDGSEFFRSLVGSLKPRGLIAFSTPNEDLLPLEATGNHFHARHYTLAQTLELAESSELDLITWAGQDCYSMVDGRQGAQIPPDRMELREREPGQFTMTVARKRSGSAWARLTRPR